MVEFGSGSDDASVTVQFDRKCDRVVAPVVAPMTCHLHVFESRLKFFGQTTEIFGFCFYFLLKWRSPVSGPLYGCKTQSMHVQSSVHHGIRCWLEGSVLVTSAVKVN